MEFNKENISSVVMLIMIPVFTYFGISEATQSTIAGVIVALILLAGQIYNEKYNSDLISGSEEELDDTEAEC